MNPLEHLWAADERAMQALLSSVDNSPEAIANAYAQAKASLQEAETPDDDLPLQVIGDVGIITASGVLTKRRSFWGYYFGARYSMGEYIRSMDLAESLDHVKQVILRIDSPGGTVAGITDLAGRTRRLAQSMKVVAFADDQMCSAGYWWGSQASTVIASKAALVGSIGVIAMMVDSSEAYRKRGVRVIPIRSGALKAPGQYGEELSDEQIASVQREVDSTAAVFYADVAKGRNVSSKRVGKWASGECMVGDQAVSAGLADRVDTFQNVLEEMLGSSAGPVESTGQIPTFRAALASGLQEESSMDESKSSPDATEKEQGFTLTEVVSRVKEQLGLGGGGKESAPPSPAPAEASTQENTGDLAGQINRLTAAQKKRDDDVSNLTTQLSEAVAVIGKLATRLEEQAVDSKKAQAIAEVKGLIKAGNLTPSRGDFAVSFIEKHGAKLDDEELSAFLKDLKAEASLSGPSVANSRELTVDQENDTRVVVDMRAHGAGKGAADPESLDLHAKILAVVGENDGSEEWAKKYEKTAYRLAGDGSYRGGDAVIAGGAR